MWEAISYVSSGVTLVAFLAAAAVLAYRASLKKQEALIRAAPEEDRVRMAEQVLERFQVDTSGLTKQQRYDIAMEQIRNRIRMAMIVGTVVVIIAFLATIVLIVALMVPKVGAHEPDIQPAKGKKPAVKTRPVEKLKEAQTVPGDSGDVP
jgi:hypothetical protein